jgi:hypothetical protein
MRSVNVQRVMLAVIVLDKKRIGSSGCGMLEVGSIRARVKVVVRRCVVVGCLVEEERQVVWSCVRVVRHLTPSDWIRFRFTTHSSSDIHKRKENMLSSVSSCLHNATIKA